MDPYPPMILTVDLTEATIPYTVVISIVGETISIDWGDDTVNSSLEHTYTTGASYTITISGNATQFNFSNTLNTVLTGIVQWGLGITDYSSAFKQCNNNISLPSTQLTGVINTSYMFSESLTFNQPIFIDTGSVENMSYMFNECAMFNQDINLDTHSATNMSHMFFKCSSFNKPVVFNTALVITMDYMFANCVLFNQLVTFNTTNVQNMAFMFYNTLVNQSFASFSIANILSGNNTLLYTGLLNKLNFTNLNINTYSDTLIGWAHQPIIPYYVNLGTISKSSGVSIPHNIDSHGSYLKLIYDYKWNISDGGLVYDTSSNIANLNTVVNLNNYPILKKYALLSQSEIRTRSSIIKNGFYGSRISSYIGELIGKNDSVNPDNAMIELLDFIQTIYRARHSGKPFDNLGIITAPQTLYPNINYNSATEIIFEGVPIILDAQGNPNALFFIKAHSALIFNNIPQIPKKHKINPISIKDVKSKSFILFNNID